MLTIVTSFRSLNFRQLSEVYQQSNCRIGSERYFNASEQQQMLMAEQDFYCFLQEFYKLPDAYCAVLEEKERYISALRIEPFRDGWLLSGLETHPQMRRRGYGLLLTRSVLSHIRESSDLPIYSHVHKDNVASLALHEKAGFRRISELAAYVDGSVVTSACTLVY